MKVDLAKNWLSNQVQYKQILSQLLNGLVDALKENDIEEIFLDGVTDEEVPGYSDVIKQPMCLLTIKDKVSESQYTLLEEFEKDVSTFICITVAFYNISKFLFTGKSYVCQWYQVWVL